MLALMMNISDACSDMLKSKDLLLRKPFIRIQPNHRNRTPQPRSFTAVPRDPMAKAKRQLARVEATAGKNMKAYLILDRCAKQYMSLLKRSK